MFGGVIGVTPNKRRLLSRKEVVSNSYERIHTKGAFSLQYLTNKPCFWSKLEEFGSQKIDFQAFQSFHQMKRRLFKRKRSTVTLNKRRLFNEEKKSKSPFKIKLYVSRKIWSSITQKVWMISGWKILNNNHGNFCDSLILWFRFFLVEN